MGLADYFGHFISGLAGKNRDNILSFSSGLLISLMFLILVPDLVLLNGSHIIFLNMLIGFLLMHLAEKYIYKHITNKQELLVDLFKELKVKMKKFPGLDKLHNKLKKIHKYFLNNITYLQSNKRLREFIADELYKIYNEFQKKLNLNSS